MQTHIPRLQIGTEKRIILQWQGHFIRDIHRRLNKEGTEISVRSLQCLCVKFEEMYTIQDLLRKTRPQLLTEEMLSVMDQILREQQREDLRVTLCEKFPSSPELSLPTIKRLVNHFLCFYVTCSLCKGVERKLGRCVHDPIIANSSGK